MRKKRRKNVKQVSTLGQIVDMPFEQFKEEIVKQKVSVGVINNLILTLSSSYHELKMRKDLILDSVFTNKILKEEATPALNGLYAEMTKLEQKITYLKERSKELLNTTS